MTSPGPSFDVASLSHAGARRDSNEDACVHGLEEGDRVLIAVADGVSSQPGAATASRTALEVLLRVYREQSSATAISRRLAQAAQQANIEVHDLALVVPELGGMATTLTAAVLEGRTLTTVHVGDCRLYLVRDGGIRQLTKDHTVAGGHVRRGLLSDAKARTHPGRSVLTRSLGRELIAAIDRITTPVAAGDAIIICSDGLYTVLEDREIAGIVREGDAREICQRLIDRALDRQTPDNTTVAVLRVLRTGDGPSPAEPPEASRLGAKLLRLVGR